MWNTRLLICILPQNFGLCDRIFIKVGESEEKGNRKSLDWDSFKFYVFHKAAFPSSLVSYLFCKTSVETFKIP